MLTKRIPYVFFEHPHTHRFRSEAREQTSSRRRRHHTNVSTTCCRWFLFSRPGMSSVRPQVHIARRPEAAHRIEAHAQSGHVQLRGVRQAVQDEVVAVHAHVALPSAHCRRSVRRHRWGGRCDNQHVADHADNAVRVASEEHHGGHRRWRRIAKAVEYVAGEMLMMMWSYIPIM